MSSGSSYVARFLRVRPRCRQVRTGGWVGWGAPCGPLGSFGAAGFIGVSPGVVEIIRVRWVHLVTLLGCSGSLGIAGFIAVFPGGCRVHPVSLGSLGCALGVLRFIRGCWFHCGTPCGSKNTSHLGSSSSSRVAGLRHGGCRVHPVSLG